MTEKHGSPIESLGNDRKKGFEDLEKKGFKESRIRGVKWRKAEDRISAFDTLPCCWLNHSFNPVHLASSPPLS